MVCYFYERLRDWPIKRDNQPLKPFTRRQQVSPPKTSNHSSFYEEHLAESQTISNGRGGGEAVADIDVRRKADSRMATLFVRAHGAYTAAARRTDFREKALFV